MEKFVTFFTKLVGPPTSKREGESELAKAFVELIRFLVPGRVDLLRLFLKISD